jgi:hypothetical protein
MAPNDTHARRSWPCPLQCRMQAPPHRLWFACHLPEQIQPRISWASSGSADRFSPSPVPCPKRIKNAANMMSAWESCSVASQNRDRGSDPPFGHRVHNDTMAQGDQTKLFELLKQTSPYSDADIAELRRTSSELTHSGMDYQALAQVRASIEVVDAIRRFDKASTRFSSHGIWVMWLTLLASVVSLLVSTVALIRTTH